MDKQIISHILWVAPNLRISNGVTSFLIGNYTYLMNKGYKIDFLLIKKVDSPYNHMVENMGSTIFVYPNFDNKYSVENYKYVVQLLENNQYDIIHINTSGMYAYWALRASEKARVINRIYHSHNPKETVSLKSIVREEVFDRLCFLHTTDYLACTDHAGSSVFGKRSFSVVRNGIDFNKFKYSEDQRNCTREKLKISNDEIVVGTVCRQAEQKNPYFTVDIFKSLSDSYGNYKLLWVGSGPLLEDVKSYAAKQGVLNSILFLGDIEKVNEIYSAMDCFLLPSKYEGLGIVFLEAQASGLPCFASLAVPMDTNITENIFYYDLSDGSTEWAKKIHDKMFSLSDCNCDRERIIEKLFSNEHNINVANEKLLTVYEDIIARE